MILNFASIIFFGLCWGITVPLSKIVMEAGHHPLGLINWQMFLSAIMLGIFLLIKKQGVASSSTALKYFVIIAFIGTLIPNTFSLLAIDQLPAGIMAIIVATVPMMSLVVALLARIEAFSWMRTLGIILGACALFLIALPDASLPDPTKAPWLLVALIAPVCYAIEGNFVAARAPIKLSPIVTLFGASVVGTLILTPVVWFGGMTVSLNVVWDVSHWAIIASAAGHVAAYSGYLWLLGRAGAVFTSQIGYVVTLTGVIGAIVLLDENYGLTVWAAVAMMLFGVALVRPKKSESKNLSATTE
ncbi:DMT family transporter [Granulosicoccus sp.]|nr:DMT family transporter [Granulosicoccus sp.]MDB4224187.1 DMT family transporter [Granulosicoccus sp.]